MLITCYCISHDLILNGAQRKWTHTHTTRYPAKGVKAPFGLSVPDLGVQIPFAAPVLDYDWELALQPEDSDHEGCWMVDAVLPDASPRDVWEEIQEQDG